MADHVSADNAFRPATPVDHIDENAESVQTVDTLMPNLPNLELSERDTAPDRLESETFSTTGRSTEEEEPLLTTQISNDEHPHFASREKVPWFLKEKAPEDPKLKQYLWGTKRNKVLTLVTTLSILIFLVNLSALLVLSQLFPGGALLRSECRITSAVNTFLHLVVNIISTALLGCSNLCMQLLVAPTRKEVNSAHKKEPPVSLDIGIPSFGNLRSISHRRVTAWVLLGTASLPLHLL